MTGASCGAAAGGAQVGRTQQDAIVVGARIADGILGGEGHRVQNRSFGGDVSGNVGGLLADPLIHAQDVYSKNLAVMCIHCVALATHKIAHTVRAHHHGHPSAVHGPPTH